MSGRPFHERISSGEAADAWRHLQRAGLLDARAVLVHDLARLRERVARLHAVFPSGTLHALAIKANPVVEILRTAVAAGAGLEAASIEEVHLGLAAGCPPERMVFDSPAKTAGEIREALGLGLILNADSFAELDRIDAAMPDGRVEARCGLRINPEVGAGSIALTSVAGFGSKFGVPLASNRERIVAAFARYPWLTGLHVHVGSQGCPLEQLVEAVARAWDVAGEIGRATGRSPGWLDIGGGLPAAYVEGATPPTPEEYVAALRSRVGGLFVAGTRLITEFGRALQAGCGLALSRVEYVQAERRMVTIHLGADFLLRPVYRPDDWPHEFLVLDAEGRARRSEVERVTIVGPLCFGGDIVAREVALPRVDVGDWLVIRDTGAYTLGMWSRHCSRGMPAVVGLDPGDAVPVRVLRPAESPGDIVRFWGGPGGADAG